MKKHLLILTFFIFHFWNLSAQTEIATTSHWYNRGHYNPSSIARPGFVYCFANYRQQWVGIEGAPTICNLQVSGYSDEHNSALGLSLTKDDIGLTTSINPMMQYAYRVILRDKLYLSLGLSAGMYLRSVNADKYEADDVDDSALGYAAEKYSSPDANFGVELQSSHFIYGLSATHLPSLWKPDDEFLISNHRYVYAIYKNNDSEFCNFTAGLQVANRKNLTVVQATAIARIKKPTGLVKGPKELFDIGITAYSVKEATLLTGINISRNLRIGYTYDFNFGNLYKKNGSHEFVLEYRIPLKMVSRNGMPWYD